MSSGFDAGFKKVKELVADFRANEKFYLSPAYQEQEARRDFIDKFWLALGWDVNHETQKNPFEQEVKVERKEHGFSQRRADYAFYLAPNFRDVKFYVEAKKPHGDIATADNYFQTIRYGWSSSTPVAVLHDFEQFEIVDCRYRPHIDTALAQNLRKYKFSHYEDPEKFAEIYWLFSREAVANGSVEKFAETLPKKRGRGFQRGLFKGGDLPMGEQFLQDLDEFRDELARAFKNANPKLDGETLTELTQRTLDRLVFLRFLEDKHIEPQNHIAYFGDKGTAWQDFIAESRRLDGIYNGIVYKKHEILDASGFKLDDDSFSGICERLSHLNSPYDFNAIPIHILGSIYERFLGKVIVTTDKRARLEEKPEVRKAGGVYYTPEYIVRYIVENTVGKLIAGKTPAQIAGMRFADIACGSGSFLLGVYDLLIRHHTAYYNQNPGKAKKGDVMERDDGLHLSLQKKREILLANIHGVDIDPQAVEVAQLSLYLKLLQDETPASARNYQMEFHETLLPTLNKNIVCGNSLIGTDILTGQLFASDEEKKLNPMDFEQRFPHIFKPGGGGALRETATPLDFTFPGVPLHGSFSYKKKKGPKVARPIMRQSEGGFDAIVGNPPYIRMEEFKPLKAYLRKNYAVHAERADLYAYFIEREHKLLKTGGRFGMIVSNKFLRSNYGNPIRNFLRTAARIERITDFAGLPVFKGATVRTIVLLTSRETKPNTKTVRYMPPPPTELFQKIEAGTLTVEEVEKNTGYEVSAGALSANVWSFPKRDVEELLAKLRNARTTLGQLCAGQICMGVKSGLTEAFVIDATTRRKILGQNPIATEIIKPYLGGREVRRYNIESENKFLVYTYHGVPIQKYPAVEKHLAPFREQLKKRATKQAWYELQQPQFNFSSLLDKPKLIFPDIATEPRFALDESGAYGANTTYFIARRDLALLALLNSALAAFYFKTVCAGLEGQGEIYLRFFGQYLEGFPVAGLEGCAPQLEKLVEQMLAAKKQLAGAQSDKDKDFYTNRCDGLDRQIDALVYDLYALTPAEIQIVEGTAT